MSGARMTSIGRRTRATAGPAPWPAPTAHATDLPMNSAGAAATSQPAAARHGSGARSGSRNSSRDRNRDRRVTRSPVRGVVVGEQAPAGPQTALDWFDALDRVHQAVAALQRNQRQHAQEIADANGRAVELNNRMNDTNIKINNI